MEIKNRSDSKERNERHNISQAKERWGNIIQCKVFQFKKGADEKKIENMLWTHESLTYKLTNKSVK